MKTFGELKKGDLVYSLNYDQFGVLTKHEVSEVKINGFKAVILAKGYLKHQIIGDKNTDLEYFAISTSTIGEIAPSIEGVKQYWIREYENNIKALEEEIKTKQEFLRKQYETLNRLKSI